MTKEQEINQIIAKDMEAINNAPYPEALPKDLLVNFDEIIMGERQNVNAYHAGLLKSVLSKKDDPSELTFLEAGWVFNVLTSVQPYLISKDIDEFLVKKEEYGKLMYRYNMILDSENRKLDRKKDALLRAGRSRIIT